MRYNYFRPHIRLDEESPAGKAGVALPFSDWMDLATVVEE
jgi:hypothetical protein